MGLLWRDGLKTGLEWQDNQHKELFNQINKLFDAMKRCEGKQEISRIVRFLDGYIVKHFGDEEAAMKKFGYPESGSHIQEHLKFKRTFSEIKEKIGGGVSTSDLIKAQSFLADWFYGHICKIDKVFSEFLKKTETAV